MTETVSSALLRANTVLPLGETATPTGKFPTAMVLRTDLVVVSMTDNCPAEPSSPWVT